MAKFRYQHIVSSVENKAPLANQIKKAEIAVNDFTGSEALFIKNKDEEIVKFISEASVNALLDADAEVISAALNDLNARKLDASAYTPTDLSDYYTKEETSGASELSDEFTKYYTKDEVDSVLGSGFTESSVTEVIESNERVISSSLNDLNARKLDASAYTPTDLSDYYTKEETSGASEISTALGAKVNLSDVITAITSETSASTNPASTSAVCDFVTSHAPSITVEQVLDKTTSASTNPVSTSAVYKTINDNELVIATSLNVLNDNKADKEEDLDGIKLKKITQSAYDALVQAGTVDPNTLYIITD